VLNVLPLSSLMLYQSLYFPVALPAWFRMIPLCHLFLSFISILSFVLNFIVGLLIFGEISAVLPLVLFAFLVVILCLFA
jgi:hypothetical protein